jgi:hypothetical protein
VFRVVGVDRVPPSPEPRSFRLRREADEAEKDENKSEHHHGFITLGLLLA